MLVAGVGLLAARRPRATRSKSNTIGNADGSIIAAVIVTQTPRKKGKEPRFVLGPISIHRSRCRATSQQASASASTTMASTVVDRPRLTAWTFGSSILLLLERLFDHRRFVRACVEIAAVLNVRHRAVPVGDLELDRAVRADPFGQCGL